MGEPAPIEQIMTRYGFFIGLVNPASKKKLMTRTWGIFFSNMDVIVVGRHDCVLYQTIKAFQFFAFTVLYYFSLDNI